MTSETKFTPGPWSVSKLIGIDDLGIVNSYGSAVARIGNLDIANPANARLIAAAPELYATLEYLLPHLAELDRAERHHNRNNPTATLHAQVCINNVLTAIAKARGEA